MYKTLENKLRGLLPGLREYTGVDVAYYFKGGFWLFLRYAVNFLKSFVLSLLFARLVPKEFYGQYKYIFSVLSLVGVFALEGMGAALVQSVARGYGGTFRYALKVILKWSFLGSFVLLGFSTYYFLEGVNSLGYAFLVLVWIFPFYSVSGHYADVLSGKKNFGLLTKFSSVLSLVFFIAMALVVFVAPEPFWMALINILFTTLVNLIFTLKLIKDTRKEPIDKEAVSYGKS